MKNQLCCFVSALLGAAFVVWQTDSTTGRAVQAQPRIPQVPAVDRVTPRYDENGLSPEEAVNVFVYEQNNRGVVNITTRTVRADGFFMRERVDDGAGSGSVLDKRGHILTNFHVIQDARLVKVTLFDGKTYVAELVGADPINDTAVIRIDAPENSLFPIPIGSSSGLRVGMKVYAIGNPFGLERTMTTGIISSLNRSLEVVGNRSIKSIIQVDAAVNPGNSGGPLIDSHGRLIGVNTAIASKTGQSAGVGFAIPANLLRRVVPQLIQHGRVIRPELGIEGYYELDGGLLITRLEPGGPAEQAGLRGPRVTRERSGVYIIERTDRAAADAIVSIDGRPVETVDGLLSYVESKQPGDRVVLGIVRGGSAIQVTVTLSSDQEQDF